MQKKTTWFSDNENDTVLTYEIKRCLRWCIRRVGQWFQQDENSHISSPHAESFSIAHHVIYRLRHAFNFRKRRGRYYYLIVGSIFILSVIAAITVTLNAHPVQAAWFNTNWTYRQGIPINNTGSAQNNAYIVFSGATAINTSVLVTAGKLLSNCADIRFTDYTGNLLKYYIVSGCNTTSTIIHVLFLTLPAGNQTIYMYYGNPLATAGTSLTDFGGLSGSAATVQTITTETNGGSPTRTGRTISRLPSGVDSNKTAIALLPTSSSNSTLHSWYSTSSYTSWTDGGGTANCTLGSNSPCLITTDASAAVDVDGIQASGGHSATGNAGITAWGGCGVGCSDTHHSSSTYSSSTFASPVDDTFYGDTNSGGATDAVVLPNGHLWLVGADLSTTNNIYAANAANAIVVGLATTPTAALTTTNADDAQGKKVTNSISIGTDPVVPHIGYNGTSSPTVYMVYNDGSGNLNYLSFADGTALPNSIPTSTTLETSGVKDSQFSLTTDSSGNMHLVAANSTGIQYWYMTSGQTTWIGPYAVSNDTNDDQPVISTTSSSTDSNFVVVYYRHFVSSNKYNIKTAYSFIHTGNNNATPSFSTIANVYTDAGTNNAAYPATERMSVDGSTFLVAFMTGTASPWTVNSDLYTTSRSGLAPSYSISSFLAEEVNPGPIAYWAFNEGFGTTAHDSSSNANTGTLSGTTLPTWQTEDQCIASKCLYFNGATANVSVASISGQVQTVSLWAKPASTSAAIGLMQLATGVDVKINSGGAIGTDGITTPTVYVNSVQSGTVTANQWNHIEVTTPQGIIASSPFIGKTQQGILNGFIDEVRLYAYARTTSQVGVDYNNRGGRKSSGAVLGISQQNQFSALNNGLVGYWKMDESTSANSGQGYNGTSGEAADSSGNGNNGTYNGTKGLASTAASGCGCTTTTVNKTAAGWTVNGFTNMLIKFTSGGDNGQTATITSNTATTITFSPAMSGVPANTDTFTISDMGVGKFGNAGSFNGVDNDISLTANSNNLQQVTVCAWVNTLSGSGATKETIYAQNNGGNNGNIAFEINGDGNHSGKAGIGIWNGLNIPETYSNTSVNTGAWFFLCGTRNGATDTIFVNGNQETQITNGNTSNVGTSGFIGNNGSANWFNGTIDEVRVYSRILSNQDIQNLYNFAPGPVGQWNFEEGSGPSVNDTSGNANTGTWHGTGKQHYSAGKYGWAGNFNGVDDYVSASDIESGLEVDSPRTLNVWIKTASAVNQPFFDAGQASGTTGYGFAFWLTQNGGLGGSPPVNTPGFIVTTIGNDIYIPGLNLADNKWHNIAYTLTGQAVNIYIDGKQSSGYIWNGTTWSGLQSQPFSLPFIPDSFGALWIGQSHGTALWGNGATFFTGAIDDVQVYNYVRTPSQIFQDMNAGAARVSRNGPVGYWKFSEGYGTVANNSGNGGNALNGTLSGSTTPSWNLNGIYGRTLQFNGTTAYISIGNPTGAQIASASAISAWVYLSSNSVKQDIVAKVGASGNNEGYRLWINSSGHIAMDVSSDGQQDQMATASGATTLSLNKWYYVTGVFNPSNNITVYVNGTQDGKTTTNVPASMYNSTANLLIGAENAGATNNYNGLLDEVKLYAYNLSPAEILMDYNRGSASVFGNLGTSISNGKTASNSAATAYCVPGDTSTCSAPVGEWNFEEGYGSTVNDTSGNANTGTWNGTGSTHWVIGPYGWGGNFNGTDDYVNVTNSSSINNTTNYTVGFWMKASVSQGVANVTVIDKGATSGQTQDTYQFIWDNVTASSRQACTQSVSGTYSYAQLTSSLQKNVWYYITCTYDGTNLKAYLNGQLQTTTAVGTPDTGTRNLHIGAWTDSANGASSYFQGKVDLVKVYNYARTAAQIAWDYNRGAPIDWWKFDECQGTVTHDSTINRNDGTINIGASGSQTAVGTCTDGNSAHAWYNGVVGKFNSSLNFDGTDDNVSVANSVSGVQSVSFWAKPASTSAAIGLIQLATGTDLKINNGGTIGTDGITSPTIYVNGVSGGSVNANTWNHIVMTTGTGITSNNILFGNTQQGVLNGQLDDIRMYNYALTSVQVQNLYNGGAAVRFAPLTGSP